MRLRGNMGGQVLPGLGLSTHNALFDPMIPWYRPDVQDAIFAAKRAAGLNVIGLCSWADYHGDEFEMPIRYDWVASPNGPAQARAYCIKLRRLGFIPFFWLLGDRVNGDAWDASGANCDNALTIIRSILPAIADVVGFACPGFELRGAGSDCPYSAAQYWRMLLLMNQLAPGVYKPGHFVMENSAGSSHSPVDAQDPWRGDEIAFWTETGWPNGSTLLDGIFYQAPTGAKLFAGSDWEDRWMEMRDRLGAGNRIWPPPCTAVDLLWGEAGWFDITRGDQTTAQLIAVSQRALQIAGKWSFSG